MRLSALKDQIRRALPDKTWGAAVALARDGAVLGVTDDGEEICLNVKMRGRAKPFKVWLWPDDPDMGCDCGADGPCVHGAAAVIAAGTHKSAKTSALPEPSETWQVKIRYDLTSHGKSLAVSRMAVWPDGRTRKIARALAQENLVASRADTQAERLLVRHGEAPLPAESLRRFLVFIEGTDHATLDGTKVRLRSEHIRFQAKVTDAGEGFRLALVRPPGIDTLFRGAALLGRELRPTSHGDLSTSERHELIKGVTYLARDAHRLVSSDLPRLQTKIDVVVATTRLPRGDALEPRVRLRLRAVPEGLEVDSSIVYGDPPVLTIRDGTVSVHGDIVPVRNVGAERIARRRFEDRLGVMVGRKVRLAPMQAAEFLDRKLALHEGDVEGTPEPDRFRVHHTTLTPHLDVAPAAGADGHQRWGLDVQFDSANGRADAHEVLRAWQLGRSLVPLMDGGYAPLPMDWLSTHGPQLRELFDARDANGTVDRVATGALVELLEDTEADVPPDLTRLRSFLEADTGLPEHLPSDLLHADLRPYQLVGYQWLRFLRDMDLGGILADDMGLGKTVQTLAVLAETPGPHLVVAPTSVIGSWRTQSNTFVPGTKVCVYHGPTRKLDPDANLVLTSYALLRIDAEKLREVPWGYLVLDEAQYIKNPSSQTARAACAMPSRHRLALSGTPIENRLEELWSLFRYLMPGLLGTLASFRERFVRPLEAGEKRAAEILHRRVRPYVLRRRKREVAADLPALTQLTIPCVLPPAQRAVYEAVRLAGRADVQAAISQKGNRGATMQILEALLRMRQACCDPSLVPGADPDAPAGKLDRLEELLVDITVEGHRALVFSQWTSLLDRVEPRLRALGIEWVRLDGSTVRRDRVIDAFQDEDGPPVFLLSLKAGGTGLNLTAADYVIHLDPWWNPAVEQQATDRAHRIGQTKPVVSCKLVAQDTLEERIIELQAAKLELAESALGSEAALVNALSADELRALFDAA